MHATIEQLLAIRDREPVDAGVKQHADICLLCRDTLDELRLARDELTRLPEQTPARDHWPAILAQAQRRQQSAHRRRRLVRYGGLGLAASALLATALYLNRNVPLNPDAKPTTTSVVAVNSTTTVVKTQPAAGSDTTVASGKSAGKSTTETDLKKLISRSAQLEAELHALPRRPGIVKASTSDLISGLQDSVALIDYQMNQNAQKLSPSQSRQLWQQRVDLMNSLVNVRYAESQRVAYSPN